MKGFFLNDIYTIKRPLSLIIGITVFLSMFLMMFTLVDSDENTFFDCRMFGGMVSMILSMLVIGLISGDEKSGWLKCACTFPTSRKAYVCEKYLMALVIILLGSVVVCFPTVRLMILQENFVWDELWLSAALALFVPAVVIVFVFPLSLRFNVSKGAGSFLLIFLIGSTLFGGITILSATSDWFMNVMDFIKDTDSSKAALYVFMAALGLYGLTLPLSIAGFRKRSF